MKRIQLFEFEDLSWFPDSFRSYMTNLLAVLCRMIGTKEVIAQLLAPPVLENNAREIVDLGSGSGGIMPDVVELLREEYKIRDINLLLTDLYPNRVLIEKWGNTGKNIIYHQDAIDAADWDMVPGGFKTMINCFHHMEPKQARNILEAARQNRSPILIYEMGENKIPLFLWWILLPLSLTVLMVMALFMTPWVRSLSWKQVLFTYLIPIIPLCYAWDGQASLPRMYTMDDLDQLLVGLHTPDYLWKRGKAFKKNKKQLGTYLMGIPINN